MARKSAVPEEILQYVPCKCCQVRLDSSNVYRVYKYKAVKLPSGKWGRDCGYLIGKIIPGKGFSPNKRYLQELECQKGPRFSEGITDVAYGQYALLTFLSGDILEKLEACFPFERAAQIYFYSIILCANGFPYIDQIDDFYQESFLSVMYRDYSFKMGFTALSDLLHDLGLRGNPVRAFEQSLIDHSSGNVAIGGQVIRSCSNKNDLAEPGYKREQLKTPQVNILMACDIENKMPLLYRTYRGSGVDKSSVVELLESRSFTNTRFIVDRGFYSGAVLKLMSVNHNCYIIPLPKNDKNFKRIKKHLAFTSGEFIYKSGNGDCARVEFYEEKTDDKIRIIVYRDTDENNSKRKSYKQMMELEGGSYTQEEYDKFCDWWGVDFLQTTTDESAADVYAAYKGCWSMETYNDSVRNDADFSDLKTQDYYVQHGFDFIMLVAGLIQSRLNDSVRSLNTPNISPADILVRSGHMRMVLEDEEWRLRNTRQKDLEILKAMGFVPEASYPVNKQD